MKFGACIDTLYTEYPWHDRFKAAREDGFDYVEFWDWRSIDLKKTKYYADSAGIRISGFNGDADYSLVDPTHRTDYLAFLKQSIAAAKVLGAPSVTIHSNALGEGGWVMNHYHDLSRTVKLCSMFDILGEAAKIAEDNDILLNLEALNIHTDHVGNFLETTQMGTEIVRLINSPNLKLLYDVYHMQINEGRICDTLSAAIAYIGHVHIADAPGRHEPGTGEINYSFVLRHLNCLGYQGIVGCELFPATNTAAAVRAIMQVKKNAS
jgi:hydroxypyruvate isomerase